MMKNYNQSVEISHKLNFPCISDYSEKIDEVDENLENYNPTKKKRLPIVFDDVIAVWTLIKS